MCGGGGGEGGFYGITFLPLNFIKCIWMHALCLVSRSQTLTPREGEGESLVKCYTSSCPSASYEARPIRLLLYGIT